MQGFNAERLGQPRVNARYWVLSDARRCAQAARASAAPPASTRAGASGPESRARGHKASNPPFRYARIQSSSVVRPTVISRPSGPDMLARSQLRTSRPRSDFDSDRSAATRINKYLNRQTSSARSSLASNSGSFARWGKARHKK